MVSLNTITDNNGARKARIRVGRGIGSGKGKTCGRGVKGQKSRTGVAIKGFEGGQMPIFRRLPKRGFTNIHRTEYAVVNVGDLERVIQDGFVFEDNKVNYETLVLSGLLRSSSTNIKLLGEGSLNTALTIEVHKASGSAKSLVEAAGGSVVLL
ncbi:MAG: 50S ribosomal protein L15 [Alphaproteobacteria bacterium]|nr:MAG: 50S ribosomal protein L15 [Alphaproteobacteria bacterium]TAF13234.1 MAG: 50S ribosomal protein L15 [Alphaproteobacteria bacterium]TAF40914.1 MAG: 50S ribosomal protein L15 [Alphaproteobacteria bacterium]TAF76870.1 MAG: 50S ribosomal protein L15 [Alphaproteobacteria bacterium]